MTKINLFDYRRHIEVHGRPTPAVFRKKGYQGGKNSHQLVWTVDSYTPIQEYRLLYRQIKPYHPVRSEAMKYDGWTKKGVSQDVGTITLL